MKSDLRWHMVQWVARALDATEREAVLGDFAESGELWNRALWDVVGLVARREAARWASLRPWLILVAVIAPFSLLISVISRLTSGETSVYVWMYANNSDWRLLQSAGFWYVLAGATFLLLVQWVTLICISWTVGFVIGAVPGKYARANAAVLCLFLIAGEAVFAPRYLAFCWRSRDSLMRLPPAPDLNGPVTAMGFYRVAFPFLVQVILVAMPAIWGMHQGARVRQFRPSSRIGVWILAILSLAALALRDPGLGLLLAMYVRPAFWRVLEIHRLELVAYWPVAYLLGTAVSQRWQMRSSARL